VCFALGLRILFLEFTFRGFLLGSSVLLFFVRAVATGKMFYLAREFFFYVALFGFRNCLFGFRSLWF
jgi:hypothetical protein